MRRPTDTLIGALAAEARPVRRLTPPLVRALLWLLLVGLACAALVARFADLEGFMARMRSPSVSLAFLAALATGISAVIAACHLALPDRSRLWALAPAPFVLVWLGVSGYGCIGLGAEPGGDSRSCFLFIVAAGAPLAALLFWRLRRARPLQPGLTGAVGAIGVAGLSAALLQFFHPFQVTWLDLAVHLAALAVLVAVTAGAARPALGADR